MKIIDEIRKETEKIWLGSEEVDRAIENPGNFGNRLTSILEKERESRALTEALFLLRRAATSENIEVNSLLQVVKRFLEYHYKLWSSENWFPVGSDVDRIFKGSISALDEINTIEDLRTLLEVLLLFVGKINFLIDQHIPYYELTGMLTPLKL